MKHECHIRKYINHKRRLKPYVWLMVLIDGYKVVSFLVVKHS